MMPIYVINLPNRTDRKARVRNELVRTRLTNYKFVDAIHGNTLDVDAMKENGMIDFTCQQLKRGEYGCYLSHLHILQTILTSNQELHMILEDDVYFVRDFKTKLTKTLSAVKYIEWDILYIGINQFTQEDKQGIYVKEGIYYPLNSLWGTHAYIVKRSAVRRIINLLTPIILPIDVTLMTLSLKKLVLLDPIVKTVFSNSDTQTIK